MKDPAFQTVLGKIDYVLRQVRIQKMYVRGPNKV